MRVHITVMQVSTILLLYTTILRHLLNSDSVNLEFPVIHTDDGVLLNSLCSDWPIHYNNCKSTSSIVSSKNIYRQAHWLLSFLFIFICLPV